MSKKVLAKFGNPIIIQNKRVNENPKSIHSNIEKTYKMKGEKRMIYPNLSAEMARSKMTQAELAKALGKTAPVMSLKLSGKASISLDEAVKIKRAVGTRLSLDVLFDKDVI